MAGSKRALPIGAASIRLVAGTLFGAKSAYGQTDTNSPQPVHANHSAGHEAHARVPGFVAPTAAATPVPVPSVAALQVSAQIPAELLTLLGRRIVAKDVDGIIALQEREAVIIDWDGSVIHGLAAIRRSTASGSDQTQSSRSTHSRSWRPAERASETR